MKIGLTTREPDVRAKEIYTGSSGVPLKFDIAVAYAVGDCHRAEKTIHNRLKAYRINKRREFFRVYPSVAAAVILETCSQINDELGLESPQKYPIDSQKGQLESHQDSVCDGEDIDIYPVEWCKLSSLKESPIGTSCLSAEQLDRIKILEMMMDKIYPQSSKEWVDGFTRDQSPEREIRIWECIAKSLMSVDEVGFASKDIKDEAFTLILLRSGATTKGKDRSQVSFLKVYLNCCVILMGLILALNYRVVKIGVIKNRGQVSFLKVCFNRCVILMGWS